MAREQTWEERCNGHGASPPSIRDAAIPTRISEVLADKGEVVVRGKKLHTLHEKSGYEHFCFLTRGGITKEELQTKVEACKPLSGAVQETIRNSKQASKVDLFSTAIQMLSIFSPIEELDRDARQQETALRLLHYVPQIIGLLMHGEGYRPTYRYGASLEENLLIAINGREPTADERPGFEKKLELLRVLNHVAHGEHGMSCAILNARTSASAHPTSFFGVYTGAFTTLFGERHGGVNQLVLENYQRLASLVDDDNNVESVVGRYLMEKSQQAGPGKIIPGLGHALYRCPEKRAALLKQTLEEMDLSKETQQLFDVAKELEKQVEHSNGRRSRALHPNVDFYSCLIMHELGIPKDIFPIMFAYGLIPSIAAHVDEATQERIYRPKEDYRGHVLETKSNGVDHHR